MQWELFNRVLAKLATVGELHPTRDASHYADRLLEQHPELFARLDGGAESVAARMAARTIATDHLREVCNLPALVNEIHASLANATLTPSERLVRMAGLAYLACEHDLISDNTPHGFGFIDDCIVIRGCRIGTPGATGTDHFAADLTLIAYLSIAIPEDTLAATERALVSAAGLWLRCRDLSAPIVERALTRLMERPPSEFPPQLELPPTTVDLDTVTPPIRLRQGHLIETRSDGAMVFEFADGSKLHRRANGRLEF